MCGICGVITTRDFDPASLVEMQQTLRHRGPDDWGVQTFYFGEYSIGFGHRRLSIIDLSELGHQPMCDNDGDVSITYNGEIYNFLELRSELLAKGYLFRGNSDTEVILYSYKEWGVECLTKFQGMFVFAIYDKSNGVVLLARDRVGIKPLFYFRDETDIVFASELKSLLSYDRSLARIDNESVYQYLSFQYIPSPRSIFQDVFKLEPGQFLLLDLKTSDSTMSSYWTPYQVLSTPSAKLSSKTEQEYRLELDNLLQESITAHMISDVPLGAFLSGGVDSSLVVAAMCKVSKKPVKTFTIGFHNKQRDEAPYARKIAEYLGTEHYENYLTPQDIFEAIPDMVEHFDEPFGDSSALPTFLVSKFARQHAIVALSGDGGDELFGGYTRYKRIQIMSKLCRWAPPLFCKSFGGMLALLPIDKVQRIGNGLRQDNYIDMFHYLVAMWKGTDHRRLLNLDYDFSNTRFYETYAETQSLHLLERLMMVDFRTYLPDDGLTKVDRASMAHGLEVRVPLLDNNIVDFALRLPLKYKMRDNDQKYLLKQVLADYLPSELFRRPKKGFVLPLNQWLRHELRFLVDEYLDPARLRRRGIVDPLFVQEIIGKHMSGRYDYFFMLWSLITLEMWFDKWS